MISARSSLAARPVAAKRSAGETVVFFWTGLLSGLAIFFWFSFSRATMVDSISFDPDRPQAVMKTVPNKRAAMVAEGNDMVNGILGSKAALAQA